VTCCSPLELTNLPKGLRALKVTNYNFFERADLRDAKLLSMVLAQCPGLQELRLDLWLTVENLKSNVSSAVPAECKTQTFFRQ